MASGRLLAGSFGGSLKSLKFFRHEGTVFLFNVFLTSFFPRNRRAYIGIATALTYSLGADY